MKGNKYAGARVSYICRRVRGSGVNGYYSCRRVNFGGLKGGDDMQYGIEGIVRVPAWILGAVRDGCGRVVRGARRWSGVLTLWGGV